MDTLESLINSSLELTPDNFELFKGFNPNLTKEVYKFLRENGTEWKIICGFEIKIKYSNHFLKGNNDLLLSNLKVYKNRYNREYYLNPKNWNYGINR